VTADSPSDQTPPALSERHGQPPAVPDPPRVHLRSSTAGLEVRHAHPNPVSGRRPDFMRPAAERRGNSARPRPAPHTLRHARRPDGAGRRADGKECRGLPRSVAGPHGKGLSASSRRGTTGKHADAGGSYCWQRSSVLAVGRWVTPEQRRIGRAVPTEPAPDSASTGQAPGVTATRAVMPSSTRRRPQRYCSVAT
jgi:hypothetical protein